MVTTLNRGILIQPLENLVKKSPNKIIFRSKNSKITAKDLFENSKSIALNLSQNGVTENDVFALAVIPSFEFIEIFYALLLLKVKIAIIDPEMGRENYAAKIKQLAPTWMFVDSRLLFLNDWPWIKRLLQRLHIPIPEIEIPVGPRIVKVGKAIPTKKVYFEIKNLKSNVLEKFNWSTSENPVDNVIVYTSGTLAEPKGVLHSDLSLATTISLLRAIINGDENDIVGTYLPHFMLLGVASGLTVRIMPTRMNAKQKIDWLNKNQINIMFGPPSEMLPLIIFCEDNNISFPKHMKHLMLGSAPVHQGFLNRLISVLPKSTKITCTYGMTEHLLVAIADGRVKAKYQSDGDLLGPIVQGVDIKIDDDDEILVKSEQIFSRYLHLPNREEWHRTGDLGSFDINNNLILKGRKKEMIIRRDFNIYPALYEGTIKKIPGVNEAAMVGIYDENNHDEILYLAIENSDPTVDGISNLLAKGAFSIDKQAIPDVIFKMNIPRKGRQDKIDRSAIVNYIKENKL
jgi:acyl-CoA synthetase (AMP-forming)/AMP-acid ligase II